jgi:uncharacterized protein YndB with AHSA1/START domain
MGDDGLPAAHPASTLRQFSYRIEVELPAPPHQVWAAFTLEIDRWWNYRLRARTRCRIDPTVGGLWIQEWDNGGAVFGTFTVWDPPHLLVLTGSMAMTRPAHNVLEVHFAPAPGDATTLAVEHHSFGAFAAGTGAMYEAGWRELVGESLRAHLARR